MTGWLGMLKGDPLPWLLHEETPAVRHLALRKLLDQPEHAPVVQQARAAAIMQTKTVRFLNVASRIARAKHTLEPALATGERVISLTRIPPACDPGYQFE
jgi:hypothetical protein